MDSSMSRYLDNREVDFICWNSHQIDLAMRAGHDMERTLLSPDDVKDPQNEAVMQCWCVLFAERMRELCDGHNVALETVRHEERWPEFQRRVIDHASELKWHLSQREGKDVGWERTVMSVRGRVYMMMKDGAPFAVAEYMFPFANEKGAYYETMEFPIEDVNGPKEILLPVPVPERISAEMATA
jgi:hypothetical protein